MLNFAPISDAIDSNRQETRNNNALALQTRQADSQDSERTYQHGRDAKGDALAQVQMYGKQASAVDQMQDGPQKQAIWQSILAKHSSEHPEPLSPEESDYRTGPKLMAAAAGQFTDPLDRQEKQLGIQKTQAEIGKLNREHTGANEYGLNPVLGQDEQGNMVVMQPGKDGSLVRSKLPPGVSVDYGLKSRQQAQGKEAGTAQGKAAVNLPMAMNAADRITSQIDALLKPDSGLDRVTGAVYGRLPEMTNTSKGARDAQSRIDQINGNVFLQAYETLKGAGAISNVEGEKAEKAFARLRSQNLNTESYKSALQDLKGEVLKLTEIAKARASGGNVTGAANAPPQKGVHDLGDGFTVEVH